MEEKDNQNHQSNPPGKAFFKPDGDTDSKNRQDSGMFRGHYANLDDNYFKKQMEFKQGKLHQLITDQEVNTNKIFANRYIERGFMGFWYFLLDTFNHFENFMLLFLILIIWYDMNNSETASTDLSVSIYFPIVALGVNLGLMTIRNSIFENRQVKVTRKINNKWVSALFVSR